MSKKKIEQHFNEFIITEWVRIIRMSLYDHFIDSVQPQSNENPQSTFIKPCMHSKWVCRVAVLYFGQAQRKARKVHFFVCVFALNGTININ